MLPIFELESELCRLYREQPQGRRFVIEAPTGSGKSTQIPQMLMANGRNRVRGSRFVMLNRLIMLDASITQIGMIRNCDNRLARGVPARG